ncbi:MAG: Ig-like domain-containing protein [Peptococcaceae bacterium]|nr:Ig-like domain-containing protein [Peptococcaceae bacterium]
MQRLIATVKRKGIFAWVKFALALALLIIAGCVISYHPAKADALVLTGQPQLSFLADSSLNASLDYVHKQVDLSWPDTTGITAYEVYRSPGNDDYVFLTTAPTVSSGQPLAYVDSNGMVYGTAYKYFLIGYTNDLQVGISTTATVTVSTPPSVISVSPPNGEQTVGTAETSSGNTITVRFNQAMNQATLQNGITVNNTSPSSVSYDTATNTATVLMGTSPYTYAPNTKYTVTVTTGVTSSLNVELEKAYTWSFTTSVYATSNPHGNYIVATGQCSTCHNAHSAKGQNLLQQTSVPDMCDVCHNGSQAADTDYFGGGTNSPYTQTGHGQSSFATPPISCQNCHDPHSNAASNPNLFLANGTGQDLEYATTTGSVAYNPANFTVCTACHTQFSTYTTQQTTQLAAGNGLNNDSTDFYTTSTSSTIHDLHYLHLVQAQQDGYGNAVCYDCHRPHGVVAAENPDLANMVGFPSGQARPASTTSTTTGPIYFSVTSSTWACTLSCHSYNHVTESYTP